MKRILLIDDDQAFLRPLELILRRAGYEVQTANNGTVGLRLFRQESADLVITDLIMPEKEGLETIMALRQIQPDLKIIAMSGGGRVQAGDYLVVAEQLGATRILGKPFTREELLEMVGELCPVSE